MKITINILPAIGSVIAFICAHSISTGTAQKFIHFAGAANEAATMILSAMIGCGLLVCSFEKVNK
jgi:hypothetical protein